MNVVKQPMPPLTVHVGEPREYCDAEDFNPKCPSRDDVIVMATAVYGRMKLGRCVSVNYGYLGCNGDVIGHLDHECSGRHNCSVRLPDNALVTKTTCPKEFKMFLSASYYCVPVERSACDQCRGPSQVARITTSISGYLASSVTDGSHDSRCGSDVCPWRIEVKSGQTINITLYDFAAEKHANLNQSLECLLYARIREPSLHRDLTICGGRTKVSLVYSSVSNIVDVLVTAARKEERDGNFLFYYEAMGCPDYVTQERTWAKRYGEKIIVGCNSSSTHKWEVKCVGKQWVGETGSCPEASVGQVGAISLPLGVLMAIVLGIALVIGVLIVTVGIVYLKRQQREMMYPPGGPNMAVYMGHEPYYEIDTLDPETMQPLNTIQRQKQQLEHALTLQKQKQHLLLDQQMRTLDKKAAKKLRQAQKRQKRKGRSMSDGGRNVYARTGMESRPLPSIPVSQGRPEPPVRMDSTVSMPPQSYSMGSVHPMDYGGSEGMPVQSHPAAPHMQQQQQPVGAHTRTNSPVVQVHIPPVSSASVTPGPGFGTARRPAKPQRTSSNVKASAAASATSGASMASLASQGPTQHYTMLDPLEVQQLMARLPQNQQQQLPQQQQQSVYPQYHPLQQPSQQQLPPPQQQQHLQFLPPLLPQGGEQGVALRPCREGSQPILSDLSVGTSSWP